MADGSPRGQWPENFKRWWLWPLGVMVVLLSVSVAFVLFAQSVYNTDKPSSFLSVLATGVLLNGAVVITLGAIITTLLSVASEFHARRERAANKRLDLFRRMRAAHVRVALAQSSLAAQREAAIYHEQMRDLLSGIKDMEEIREEVRVSGRLYDDLDRRSIMRGIALIVEYLQDGVTQYVGWCNPEAGGKPKARPGKGWIFELVDVDHEAGRPAYGPEHEDWEPAGHMPPDYDEGLERSKLIMRGYVYGFSRRKLARLRAKVQRDSEARRAKETKGDELVDLNREIAVRETAGDRDWFDEVLLTPAFVMRRAGLAFDDRDQFLRKVAPSAERRTEDINPVYRTDRTAMVTCTVCMLQDDGSWGAYRNARLFTRNGGDQPWQLLAWANNPAETGKT